MCKLFRYAAVRRPHSTAGDKADGPDFDYKKEGAAPFNQAPLNPAVAVFPITTWQQMWTYEYGSRKSFFDDPEPSHGVGEDAGGVLAGV